MIRMDEVDVSKLPKKERKRLAREMEKREIEGRVKRGRMVKWLIFTLVLTVVIAGGWWIVKEVTKPLPGQKVADMGRNHVPREEWEKFAYNSNPPTSGPHDPEWIRAGIYNDPQGDGYLIHSLEHGYVIISYRCEVPKVSEVSKGEATPAAERDQDCVSFVERLKERVNRDSYKLILVPRLSLDTHFALTAWGRIDTFMSGGATAELVEQFIRAFRNKGPEKTIE